MNFPRSLVEVLLTAPPAQRERAIKQLLDNNDLDTIATLASALLSNFEMASQVTRRDCEDDLAAFLTLSRASLLLRKISLEANEKQWFELIMKVVRKANFTTGAMFQRHAQLYGNKPLFRVVTPQGIDDHSWLTVADRIKDIALSLHALIAKPGGTVPVAILSENCLDMALIDLACLCYGIPNVMIPANSVANHVEYILNQCQSQILFISSEEQLEKLANCLGELKNLRTIVGLQQSAAQSLDTTMSFDEFLVVGKDVNRERLSRQAGKIRLKHLATVMYTSGTTQAPKGIMFSHLNIVSKRFARGLALPEIGETDTFLCYLPLFHTFGRWLEMVGCVYWGSTYVFAQNPRAETLVDNMARVRPTVFISIPRKWSQLYDKINASTDLQQQDEKSIAKAIKQFTGGNLKWGLSAAGFLDPDIFSFFHRGGVELLSGFGMTEATGGITMTPPSNYKAGSVGKALPGIKIKLASDGEMMIKGPYVMKGYLKGEDGFNRGWFCTGDIFVKDAEGFYTIVDRKKEIYKNIKGQTIAPQKIENLFKDFEAVKRVYLVGDHREYNTVLIYPNYDSRQVRPITGDVEQIRAFFNSIIVSINRFLAPYERIVDFEIIDRDLDLESGELTEKGTYKRKTVNENFRDSIEKMYEAPYARLHIDGLDLLIPNWLLRQQGLTTDDLKVIKSAIMLKPSRKCLTVARVASTSPKIRLGHCNYELQMNRLDLGELFEHPQLWLGNDQLVEFVGKEIFKRSTVSEESSTTIKRLSPDPKHRLANTTEDFLRFQARRTRNLRGLHLAASVLPGSKQDLASNIIQYLASFFVNRDPLAPLARVILQRTAAGTNKTLKREALLAIIINEPDSPLETVLEDFLAANPTLLNKASVDKIAKNNLSNHQVEAIGRLLAKYARNKAPATVKTRGELALPLLMLLTEYGRQHPVWYQAIRLELMRISLFGKNRELRTIAKRAAERLTKSFRNWLGINQQMAVDPETANEYGWSDVLTFEEGLDPADRKRITKALQKFPVIREAIFLFTSGTLIRLQDISHRGVWVSFVGALHGKSVYRISVQTRHTGGFDIALNLNKTQPKSAVASEISWLVCANASQNETKLVEDFGGYWPEYDLWTEEFIPGETVSKYLSRIHASLDDAAKERLKQLWPYLAWNGISAYVDFWRRTGFRLQISDPTPENVVCPPHDYHVGSRIVSISNTKKFQNTATLILSFYLDFVKSTESSFRNLRGACDWSVVFSAFPEVLGEVEGIRVLRNTLTEVKTVRKNGGSTHLRTLERKLRTFLEASNKSGFMPQRLHFAVQRFQRWRNLNPQATPQAQMQTLQELYSTYHLDNLEDYYPGTRIQFFRDTVLAQSEVGLRRALDQLVIYEKQERVSLDGLVDKVASLIGRFQLKEEEQFFLTRMSYPHLRPTDTATFISLTEDGTQKAELVVFIKDHSGRMFSIRNPTNPKEIARLHRHFTLANLPVEFRPENEFLVVLDESSQVVGGLFYRQLDESLVHLEKIVVAATHRKQGISEGLLRELFNRLHSRGIRTVTVGFLRPEFFYRFGFKIDQSYGNMVKHLQPEEFRESQADMLAAID